MKLALLGTLVAVSLSLPASAGSYLYHNLGTVIGSETYCGLTYDQGAIKAFIEKHVTASDRDFIGDLDMRVSNVGAAVEHMSLSEKTAHCTQVTRAAKAYGFIK
jgi:hypothetical protein